MFARRLRSAEQARAFEDDIDTQIAPGQFRRITLGEDFHTVAIDDDVTAVDFDGTGKSAMRGIATCQACIGGRIAEVIEGHHVELAGTAGFVDSAKDVATDTTVAVDADLDCHGSVLQFYFSTVLATATTLSVVKPKCSKSSPAGADSPKRSRPTTAPAVPT